jgi:hypothetical protein
MSRKDVEAIITKIGKMNEKIADCSSIEELEKLQRRRESYIVKEFEKIRASKKV